MATKIKPGSKALTAKAREALAFARQKAAQTSDWIEFHNARFGMGGHCTELFPTQAERVQFGKTDEHRQIMALLEQLQGSDTDGTQPVPDASGRFVLRLPQSMHAALIAEARAEGISLNQLCVAKLATQLRAHLR
jgi:predicted HicB family RNase H-like nuclease